MCGEPMWFGACGCGGSDLARVLALEKKLRAEECEIRRAIAKLKKAPENRCGKQPNRR